MPSAARSPRSRRRPHVIQASWDFRAADLGIFCRWVSEDLDEGRLWFNLPAFIDAAYQMIAARIVPDGEDLYTATLRPDEEYRVGLTLEVREMPRLGNEAHAAALLGGEAGAGSIIDALDVAVNVELPEAAT